jgi:aspartyl-tRNA(Asn)/glutamyl-tRNA(Gln) amidotransferase subunit A
MQNAKLSPLSAGSRQNAGQFKIQNLKVGIPKEYFGEGIDKEVREVLEKAIKKIEKEGVKIEEISLPHTKYALACYYIISTSEASANLARYDGIRYGMSDEDSRLKTQGSKLLDVYLETRGKGFGKEVKRRIMLGTYALSAGYYDAYYLRAQKVRTLIKKDFENAFKKVDFIFTPVSPFLAFKIGEKIDDPLKMYLSDIFTVSANLAGMPALSLPCGKVGKLPVGLQIIGKPFSEAGIFEVGKFIEKIL